jgi:signal peptidase I
MSTEPAAAPVRRPGLAALLSISAGAGHLYAGWPKAGFRLMGIDILSGIVIALVFFYAPGWPGLVAFVIYLGWRVAVAVSASRLARDRSRVMERWRGRRLALAIIGFIGISAALSQGYQVVTRALLGEAFRIPSNGMAPTVRTGDYILVRRANRADVERDAICVFHAPDGVLRMMRIVARAGDTIEMHSGVLIRNGVRLAEPYVIRDSALGGAHYPEMLWQRAIVTTRDSASYTPTLDDWGPIVIPAGRFFALGDNRTNSLDSRFYGFLHDSAVTHIPVWIYFSRDPESGIRWSRVGLRIGS